MPTEGLVIDSTAESSSNVPLDLMAAPFAVTAIRTPTPPLDSRWAQPADADGDRLVALRYLNREIVVTVEIVPTAASASSAQTALRSLADKLAKVNRQGGTLRRTLPTGDAITFDLLTADQIDPSWDPTWDIARALTLDVHFTAKPFWRGTEVAYRAHTETSLPVLVFTETAPTGDVPALGRLVLTDAQGVRQGSVVWGIQSEHYDSAATAALFYEAEACTPLGDAAVALIGGASGSGSNAITEGNLDVTWAGVLSTNTAGGSTLTHVGTFRFFARCYRPTTNNGAVSVALEWAAGDFLSWTTNTQVDFAVGDSEGVFTAVDLGLVSLPAALKGTQSWEGRIIAKSTVAGDDVSIDCFWLVPVEEGSGEITSLSPPSTPTSFLARDGFDQTSGSLAGKALSVGGTWSGAGDTDDFVLDTTGHTAQRTATSDTAPRFEIAGTTSATAVNLVVSASSSSLANSTYARTGVFARYADVSNYVYAAVLWSWRNITNDLFSITYFGTLYVGKVIAGVDTQVGSASLGQTAINAGVTVTMAFTANTDGSWTLAASLDGSVGSPMASGYDAALATGGALASGKYGLYDYNPGSTAQTRKFDNFQAWVPVADAAIYANRSLEVRNDGVIRQDSSGLVWTRPSSYEGDYLVVPVAGPEGRNVRAIAKASRQGADAGIDDLTGQLYVTPRGLIAP